METTGAAPDIPAGEIDPAIFAETDLGRARACKILIIDDEPPNVRLLERVLTSAGFDKFISTTDSREAAVLFADFEPDLVLTDWLMPKMDGCAVIEQLRALTATDDYLPIVVLTADVTAPTRKKALTVGATDFLTKPFDPIEVVLRIQNLLRTRLSHLITQAHNATLEESVRQRTIELEQALIALERTQKQVIQQERLSALGAMAGGIAHDFNNALSIIMGFGELLLRDAEHGLTREEATAPLTTILTAAEDGANIVHRLREFYRPEEAGDQRLPVDLNQLVQQAVSLTQARWRIETTARGHQIVVQTNLDEIPLVNGNAADLREVLTNLIFNAVDALPEGGTITLRTRQGGELLVFLEISDTGTGMSEEVRQRCFEPFFTTKGQGGTGLGLAMVFGIIQRHGGTVTIESEPGQGTTFTLCLPVSKAGGTTAPGTQPASTGSLRILVVDDQPVLCQLVCQHLQDDLHAVVTALSGHEALETFRAAAFDLVITDHVMAEMTGEQLAVEIKKLDPKVPVILLTGYGGDASASENQCPAIDLVLAKPVSRSALRRAVASVVS